MKGVAECPRCHCVVSLVGRGNRAIYCSVPCRNHARNRRSYAQHLVAKRASNREYMRLRRAKMLQSAGVPLPFVDTACLPVMKE